VCGAAGSRVDKIELMIISAAYICNCKESYKRSPGPQFHAIDPHTSLRCLHTSSTRRSRHKSSQPDRLTKIHHVFTGHAPLPQRTKGIQAPAHRERECIPRRCLLQVRSAALQSPSYRTNIHPSDKINPDKPISAGFYRLEKGTPLEYTYTYDEMKIIIEGSFTISDETGKKVNAKPGKSVRWHAYSLHDC
jgi:uncharacterized cupin superfamily protein